VSIWMQKYTFTILECTFIKVIIIIKGKHNKLIKLNYCQMKLNSKNDSVKVNSTVSLFE